MDRFYHLISKIGGTGRQTVARIITPESRGFVKMTTPVND